MKIFHWLSFWKLLNAQECFFNNLSNFVYPDVPRVYSAPKVNIPVGNNSEAVQAEGDNGQQRGVEHQVPPIIQLSKFAYRFIFVIINSLTFTNWLLGIVRFIC